MILTSPVSKGDELLLDYCLQEPLPKWAKDWYDVTTTTSATASI